MTSSACWSFKVRAGSGALIDLWEESWESLWRLPDEEERWVTKRRQLQQMAEIMGAFLLPLGRGPGILPLREAASWQQNHETKGTGPRCCARCARHPGCLQDDRCPGLSTSAGVCVVLRVEASGWLNSGALSLGSHVPDPPPAPSLGRVVAQSIVVEPINGIGYKRVLHVCCMC